MFSEKNIILLSKSGFVNYNEEAIRNVFGKVEFRETENISQQFSNIEDNNEIIFVLIKVDEKSELFRYFDIAKGFTFNSKYIKFFFLLDSQIKNEYRSILKQEEFDDSIFLHLYNSHFPLGATDAIISFVKRNIYQYKNKGITRTYQRYSVSDAKKFLDENYSDLLERCNYLTKILQTELASHRMTPVPNSVDGLADYEEL